MHAMENGRPMYRLVVAFLLLALHCHGEQRSPESPRISQEVIDNRADTIRLFEFEKVDKEHACNLIRCSESDVCAVLDNVALCIDREKAKQILQDATEPYHDSSVEVIVEKSNSQYDNGDKRSSHYYSFHRTGPKVDQFDGANTLPRKHVEDYDNPCTDKQLVTIEDLLINWFGAIRRQITNAVSAPLPKHHVRCHADVGWMFVQLDRNRDGHLEHDELYTLDHEKYKNCIHHFLDQCDVDQDALLSVDEWCDCFEWAGRENEEPPCHAARRLTDPHSIGSFLPRCNPEGFYRPEQCHEEHCWCVDKWGREFDHSRSVGHHPDCGQYAETEEDDD